MAIKGSLGEVSLPDVIQLLTLGQKTGRLSLSYRNNFGSIYFDRGYICYAQIINRRDRLGDMLVKRGRITQEQLEEAIALQDRDPERRLGEILINMGAVDKRDLEEYIAVQIEEAVYYLFTWNQGTFNFESDTHPEDQDFLVAINPESLLLEGARRVDEWALIEKKIPGFDVVVTLDRERLEAADVRLTEEQSLLVDLIDGQRDVAALVRGSGLGEFEVGKALYGLMTAGFVHRSRHSTARKPEVADNRVDEHRNLGVAFYRTSMYDESLREFKRVIELRPSEGVGHFFLGLLALRQARWEDAVASFERAREIMGQRPAVLHNLAFAFERVGNLDKADEMYEQAATVARYDPRILIGWAISALKRGEYEEASGRLDRARELARDKTPTALWYWGRALAASCLQNLDVAESLLREGVEAHPDSAILKNNLGVVCEIRGNFEEAESFLDEAFYSEPSLPQISKNLGDLAYRAGNYEVAEEHYRRALRLDDRLGDDVHFKMGNLAYKKSNARDAATFWKKTLELNPGHELARSNLDTMNALSD